MSAARRTFTRLGAATGTAGLLTLGLAGAASAHVSVTPSDTGAGAYTILTFSVPHGCEGSPTKQIAISLPDGINEAAATRNPFYSLTTTTEKLAEPLVAEDGDEVTERTSTVTYTADTPLPDGERDTFELSLQLPEDAEGQTLAFPVIQTCVAGETAWTEVPAVGQSEDDLDHPAPAVLVAPVSAETDTAAQSSDEAATADDDRNGLEIAGLVAGVGGLLLGGTALTRSRRAA